MKRSLQSLSHNHSSTFDMGELIPISWFDAMPGDTIQAQTAMLIRTNPLLTPLMHPVYIHINHWLCPIRLLWDDFPDFITGGEDGADNTEHPYINVSNPTLGSLADYLGLPTYAWTNTEKINALPFRCYAKIYNEHFRDTELQSELTINTGNGVDATTSTVLKNVNWAKDYFTSARGNPQLGSQVTVPIGEDAPITGFGLEASPGAAGATSLLETDGSAARNITGWGSSSVANRIEEDPSNSGYPNIRADLSAATGVDINDLRLALSIQRFQEARQRYGSRYSEYLKYLGVKGGNIDARLQRPEFLAGGRQSIAFSEVVSTADSGSDIVGTLRGHGISAVKSNKYRRFVEEHSIVMTMAYVRPKAVYTQGIFKKWFKTTKEDYFNKELQYVGDEEVMNKELYAGHTSPDDTFGYQGRYDSYRYHPSFVSANMNETTYNTWHLGRVFTGDPTLNSSFITCTPSKRIFANTSDDCLQVAANNRIRVRRPMAARNIPKTF